MKLLNAALASLAMLVSSAAVAAPVAQAQDSAKIVVIDQNRIMAESAGGKDIIAKVNAIETSIQNELGPIATSLQTEGDALDAKTANMTMEAFNADTQLRAEAEAYARKAQDFNRRRQIAQAEFQATERVAWNTFFQAMQPVLQEVITETNADIMIDRSDLVWAGESVDVTQSVITKMDAALPTVNVVRQKLPTQAQQQQPQQ